ncbi:MAG: BPL-N domain-containing protein [Chlamydiota bacterium]|nr:BPL-N domain-containing protein [Chlamydiota bacterium]
MNTIYIYHGTHDYAGVDCEGVIQLVSKFKEITPNVNINFVDAANLESKICVNPNVEPNWEQKIVLVFPGGKASIWDEQLGETVHTVRSFIERGGNGLFICAGAYWSAKESLFTVSEGNSIYRKRPLQFFPGAVKGPIKFSDSCVVHVKDEINNISGAVFLYEGGYFETNDQIKDDFTTLSTYPDKKIAAIRMKVGLGKIVSTCVHYEFDGMAVVNKFIDDETWEKFQEINSKLLESKHFRTQFFVEALKFFGDS